MSFFLLKKKNLFCLLAVLFLALQISPSFGIINEPKHRAYTANWSGQIFRDTTWRDTVTVTADVVVMPGVVLTILPGTTVNFVQSKSSKIDAFYFSAQTELIIRGRLIAAGKPNRPIIFTSDNTEKKTGDWAGIYLDSRERSVLSNCVIEYAETALSIFGGAPLINNNQIDNCRYAIVSQLQSAPLISLNTIVNSEVAITCLPSSQPKIHNNVIENSQEEAIFIGLGTFPIITESNRFKNNRYNIRWMGERTLE